MASFQNALQSCRARDDAQLLSQEELLRYSRHLLIEDIALPGQLRLKASRVLVVGVGGLGSPLGLYLAAAGIGHLGLVDFDVVELTNLQRQVIHGTKDVGRLKLDSALDRILDVNPNVHVERYGDRLTAANALEIFSGYDIVVDGSDNFPTRYLTNDACVLLGIPNIYASISRFEGQASVFAMPDGPCYRCIFREPPPPGLVPSCAEGGVLGVLPGLLGTIQATETLKILLGIGDPLIGTLLLVDALAMRFRRMTIEKDPECPACGTRELRGLIDYEGFCESAETILTRELVPEMTPVELASRLSSGDPPDIIDVREPFEWDIARINGARLVPAATIQEAMPTIRADRDIVLVCKSGARSARVADQLRAAGIVRVWNLAGGIARWSIDVDDTVPRY